MKTATIIATLVSLNSFAANTPLGFVECESVATAKANRNYKISMFPTEGIAHLKPADRPQKPSLLKIYNTIKWSKKNYLPRSYLAEAGNKSFHLIIHDSNVEIDVNDDRKFYRGKASILGLNGKMVFEPIKMNCLIGFMAK